MLTVAAVVPSGAPVPPTRTSYISFARGGVTILSERQAAFANPAYGSWEHQSGNEFAFTVVTDAFNATGNLIGTVKIRNKINLTGPDEFASVGQLEVRDPAGNLVEIDWPDIGTLDRDALGEIARLEDAMPQDDDNRRATLFHARRQTS